MDLKARKAANLSVLRRHDPSVVDLLDQSSHAVVYCFDQSKAGWAKKGIEGTVFLIKRNVPPHYGIYILNRLSIDNYRLLLTDDLVIELQDEYIIYQTPSDDICCLWLYEVGDRERICKEMINMRDAKDVQMTPSAGKSIDVATLFGTGANGVQTSGQQPVAPTSVSLDQLFGRASLNEQQTVNSPAVGKSVDVAALFQKANPQAVSAMSPPQPKSLPLNDLFTNAIHQTTPPPPPGKALSINDLFNNAMQQPPAPVQSDTPESNPSLTLLNQLRGNTVKEPVMEQVPSNPATALLDILKKAKPLSPQGQQQQSPLHAPPPQAHMQSPAKYEQRHPTYSPSVQQQSPIINQQHPVAVNGSSHQQPNPLIALLQGASVTKSQNPTVASPRNQVKSPRLNQHGSQQRPYTSPKATAAKPTLLDTLMGASPAKQLPRPPQQPPMQMPEPHPYSPQIQQSTPPHPLQQRRSLSGAPPLLPQQAQELTSPRIQDRIKSPMVLSKPEFIQQYLNLIQSDATFLDSLYNDYISREASNGSNVPHQYPVANTGIPSFGMAYPEPQLMHGYGGANHQ